MSTTLGILAMLASVAAPFQATGVSRQRPTEPTNLVWQSASTSVGAAGWSLPLPKGIHNLRVPVPSFGMDEQFVLGVPDPSMAGPGDRPLLVVFHQFGVSHADVVFNTDFVAQAMARGWYLLGPLSRSPVGSPTINYGSADSQQFTRAGLEYVLGQYPIDRSRIYGVGFSMGGAAVSSYAARHMDPDAGMFAAVVNHTGSVDQADTWVILSQNPTQIGLMETIFGGNPSQQPFAYRRASCIELDPLTLDLAPAGTHMASNLRAVPVQFWWAQQDPRTYLVNQTEVLAGYLGALPGAVVDLNPVPSGLHSWDVMRENEACQWLGAQQLQVPLVGSLLVDRDARWYYFDVALETPGQFGSFEYAVDPSAGLLSITGSQGLQRIETDLADWGPSSGSFPLTVEIEALDAADVIVLKEIPHPPMSATRDGVPVSLGWFHNQFADTLTITELETGLHIWSFLP
ncbi:MAG: pimeloyl-ACP methyl ester carboxylesterase [Planctomycetota bacterium]|jgi:pimeloyl-ACP methyl ester carboxylesterase